MFQDFGMSFADKIRAFRQKNRHTCRAISLVVRAHIRVAIGSQVGHDLAYEYLDERSSHWALVCGVLVARLCAR